MRWLGRKIKGLSVWMPVEIPEKGAFAMFLRVET
jgi:hypothetical protein